MFSPQLAPLCVPGTYFTYMHIFVLMPRVTTGPVVVDSPAASWSTVLLAFSLMANPTAASPLDPTNVVGGVLSFL